MEVADQLHQAYASSKKRDEDTAVSVSLEYPYGHMLTIASRRKEGHRRHYSDGNLGSPNDNIAVHHMRSILEMDGSCRVSVVYQHGN